MEGRLSTAVSSLVLFLLIASYTAADEESGIQAIGRLGNNTKTVVFAPLNKDAVQEVALICDLGEVSDNYRERNSTRWSFTPKIGLKRPNLASYCGQDSDNRRNETITECEVSFKRNETNNHLLFILELEKLNNFIFGEYVCHAENGEKNDHTFILHETVTITRRHKGKIQRGVIVTEGDPLDLYCNATGLQSWHEISWLLNGTDITDDLHGGMGLFENFTKTDNLTFVGNSVMEHRGNYTCRVDLREQTSEAQLTELREHFPIEFSVYIRIHEPGGWKLPVYILIGETGLIVLFTIIVNIREKRFSEGEADGDYEDSDDEDETEVSKNGGMNNNSSSS